LVSTTTRRSLRLNNLDAFKHVQLDDVTRKKRKTVKVPALHSLDAPPKPTDAVPAPVPVETLQEWAIQCSVPPSEVTLDSLLNKVYDDAEGPFS
jgi:hypothetical protein